MLVLSFLIGCCSQPSSLKAPNDVHVRMDSVASLVLSKDEGETYFTYCSSVWISRTELLTAFHCFSATNNLIINYKTYSEGASTQMPKGFKITPHSAILKSSNEDEDIAILEAVGDIPKHSISEISDNEINVGDQISVIGHTIRYEHSYLFGVISAIRTTEVNPFDEDVKLVRRVLQISVPAGPGTSGGPAYDRFGKIVGICSYMDRRGPNLLFFSARDAIKELIAHSKRL